MKIQWKKLLICLAIPLGVGVLAGLITRNSMQTFAALNKPPLAPPGWLFPVVWTILYLMMGFASYLVLTADHSKRKTNAALQVYGWQLGANFIWPLLFFSAEAYLPAFLWLLLLWALIAVTLYRFAHIRPLAGWLLVPYLIWVTFAGYLNLGIYLLNR